MFFNSESYFSRINHCFSRIGELEKELTNSYLTNLSSNYGIYLSIFTCECSLLVLTFFFFYPNSQIKVFIKSVHLFGGTFAVITICSIGNFIASVLCLFVASVSGLLRVPG